MTDVHDAQRAARARRARRRRGPGRAYPCVTMEPGHLSHLRAALAVSGIGALSSPEDVFRVLTARAPVGVFVAAATGEYEYVNERWCSLAGIPAERAFGDGWAAALHPDDAAGALAAWARAVERCSDGVWESRFLQPDGSAVHVETHVAAIRDAERGVVGWIGTCVDLTARRASRDAADSERVRGAVDNAPIGIGLVTRDGAWLHVNAAFCRLLGYTEEELLTLSLADLTVPGDATVKADESEETRSETRYLRADGTTLWVAVSTTLVRGVDGN